MNSRMHSPTTLVQWTKNDVDRRCTIYWQYVLNILWDLLWKWMRQINLDLTQQPLAFANILPIYQRYRFIKKSLQWRRDPLPSPAVTSGFNPPPCIPSWAITSGDFPPAPSGDMPGDVTSFTTCLLKWFMAITWLAELREDDFKAGYGWDAPEH